MSYSESLSKLLASVNAAEGCRLSVKTGNRAYTGLMMPRHDMSAPDTLVLKLDSGYNIGVRVEPDAIIEVLEKPVRTETEAETVPFKKGLKILTLIGTGGTIASRIDYRTGRVEPAMSGDEILDLVPEIRDIANVNARPLFSMHSDNMNAEHWKEIAKAVAEELNNGADGVLISHGTDTLGYTAAALSFMLGNLSKPVVLVGAQRSSDRPSTDATSNLIAGARFCVNGNTAGVFVAMHETVGDDSFVIHSGTRVRKMHSSRRDAFRSMNVSPVARIDMNGKIEHLSAGKPVSDEKVHANTGMEENCVLLHCFPGMKPEVFEDVIMKSKGVVLAGTGLGHITEEMIPLIRKATDADIPVVMTTQCLEGTVNLNVYSTGRNLVEAGVIPAGDMLPETAFVKLMWLLANCENENLAELMTAPFAGETGDRRVL